MENTINGSGRMQWPDLSYYSGEIRNGIRHGVGTYASRDSPHIYSGEWTLGKNKKRNAV